MTIITTVHGKWQLLSVQEKLYIIITLNQLEYVCRIDGKLALVLKVL